jgi:hypothetical protein
LRTLATLTTRSFDVSAESLQAVAFAQFRIHNPQPGASGRRESQQHGCISHGKPESDHGLCTFAHGVSCGERQSSYGFRIFSNGLISLGKP